MPDFKAIDVNGIPFKISFDGAEGIGYWIMFENYDEDWYPLSLDDSQRLLEWAAEQLHEGMG